jgi:hypothetical protein
MVDLFLRRLPHRATCVLNFGSQILTALPILTGKHFV